MTQHARCWHLHSSWGLGGRGWRGWGGSTKQADVRDLVQGRGVRRDVHIQGPGGRAGWRRGGSRLPPQRKERQMEGVRGCQAWGPRERVWHLNSGQFCVAAAPRTRGPRPKPGLPSPPRFPGLRPWCSGFKSSPKTIRFCVRMEGSGQDQVPKQRGAAAQDEALADLLGSAVRSLVTALASALLLANWPSEWPYRSRGHCAQGPSGHRWVAPVPRVRSGASELSGQ